MKNVFKKMIFVVLAAVLVFAAFPLTSAFADTPTSTPALKGELTNEKLEKVWARQLKIHERIGKMFTDTDSKLAKAQALIDKAAANGRDVTAVQSALDAFKVALKNTKPIYESMNGIVNPHQGFDASGKVTDLTQAKSTVEAMGAKLKDVKTSMNGTGKALRQAIRDFRKANK
jgi:hypothetical protein